MSERSEAQQILKWLHAAFRDAHRECFAWRPFHEGGCREQWMADLALSAPSPETP